MKKRLKVLFGMTDNLYKIVKYMVPSKRNKAKRKMVYTNRRLKNAYAGEQCFILGNGPSIRDENLKLLNGKYIFTVNQMIRKKEFEKLKPICNFWFDPVYFDENVPEDSKKEFEILFKKTCACNDKIINFVPVSAYRFLQDHGLMIDRVHFINDALYYYDNYDQDFDLADLMPGFQNIVQYAIASAIYMGFKEIYLLGCDSTGIITKIDSVMDQGIEKCYGYDLGEKGQKYVNSLLDCFSIEEQFAGWTRIFHLYGELYKYCSKRKIKLINCSKKTIIESIPRVSLEKVINKNGCDEPMG